MVDVSSHACLRAGIRLYVQLIPNRKEILPQSMAKTKTPSPGTTGKYELTPRI
jgi:hypothetical protein